MESQIVMTARARRQGAETAPAEPRLHLSWLSLLPCLLPGLLGLLATTALLPAQEEEEVPPYTVEVKGEMITISVNENKGLPLKDFIKLAQGFTDKTFTFLPDEIGAEGQGKEINFIGPMRLKRSEFFGFFQTMLYIRDFACVIRGEGNTEIVEIIYMRGGKRTEITSGAHYVLADDLVNYRSQTGVTVLTSIPLKHLNGDKAMVQLRPFFAGAGAGGQQLQFGGAGNQRFLLIQGFAPQVYSAYQLLRIVDVPEETIELLVEPVPLEYATAEELEPLLNDILGDRSRRPPTTGITGAGVAGQAQQLKIFAQVTSNTLILSGSKEQITEAKDLIAVLDQEMEDTLGAAHVIRVLNNSATELRSTVREFINEEQASEQLAQTGVQAGAARRPRKPVIVAHEESNKLIISAPASKLTQLRRIITDLDERQRQVLVECAVVELSTSDLSRFGIELGVLDIKDSGDFTRPFGFTHFGQSVFEDTDDDGLPDTRLPDFDNPLTGLTGGIISGGDFAIPVLLNALAEDNRANILSLPSVVVNDNENALVKSKEERPTQTSTQGTSTTQQGFGGFEDAGITLNISPSISSNNYLRLNVDLSVSRFITAYDPNSVTPGVISTRQIQTQVTLPSGHTMIVGGVIEDQESTTETGIPFLKDIPLLGWLFKTHANENRKVNLYFFITPHILDEDDFSDLANLSTKRKLEAEEYIGRRRMQIVDPRWKGQISTTLEDSATTIDDLDAALGGSGFVQYDRPPREEGDQNAPPSPPSPPEKGAPNKKEDK